MPDKTRREKLLEMLALEPNDAFLRYGLAMEYVSAGQDEEAARCFRELVDATPDYVPAYLQAGQALIRLARNDEAKEMLSRGSEIARRQGDLHAYEEMQGFLAGLG
jgi:predicted Zn-dependent protease